TNHSRWPGQEVSRNRRPVTWLPVVAEPGGQDVCGQAEPGAGDLDARVPGERARRRDEVEVEIGCVSELVLGEEGDVGGQEKARSGRRLKARLDVRVAESAWWSLPGRCWVRRSSRLTLHIRVRYDPRP